MLIRSQSPFEQYNWNDPQTKARSASSFRFVHSASSSSFSFLRCWSAYAQGPTFVFVGSAMIGAFLMRGMVRTCKVQSPMTVVRNQKRLPGVSLGLFSL